MSLSFYGKRPGPGMRLDKLSLQFAMHDTGLIGDVLEAYERLILDALLNMVAKPLAETASQLERPAYGIWICQWKLSKSLFRAYLLSHATMMPIRTTLIVSSATWRSASST